MYCTHTCTLYVHVCIVHIHTHTYTYKEREREVESMKVVIYEFFTCTVDVEGCNEVGGGVSYYDDQCGLIPVPNNLIYVTLNKSVKQFIYLSIIY